MGFFNFFGKLFGSEKALTSTVTAVRDGLDSLVYTDEEKAQDAAKERSEARSMIIDWMNATQGQNLTRRFLAVSFTMVFMFALLAATAVSIAGIWIGHTPELTQTYEALKGLMAEVVDVEMLIIGFYFAAPYMDKIFARYKGDK